MKLEPVSNLDKRHKTTSKKFWGWSCWQMVTSLSFFWFMANYQQSRSHALGAYSVKHIFLLIVNFHLKLKTELRNLSHSSNTKVKVLLSDWVKVVFSPKETLIFCKLQKNADIELKFFKYLAWYIADVILSPLDYLHQQKNLNA